MHSFREILCALAHAQVLEPPRPASPFERAYERRQSDIIAKPGVRKRPRAASDK